MIQKLLLKMARHYRGPDFQLDPDVHWTALAGLAMRRGLALLRCPLRGIVCSLNPKRWIFVGSSVELLNRRYIHFGTGVTLQRGVSIDGLSREGIRIGNSVNIGPYTQIIVTGQMSHIGKGFVIGENSAMGAFSFVGAVGGVTIGKRVIMGQRVSFHAENHCFERLDVPIQLQGVTHKGIVVDDDCWIGANVVFLDGAQVGHGCVIAAGAVVRGVIPPLSVAGGVPARILKSRDYRSLEEGT